MHDILKALNELAGVKGSMLTTHEGIVVAANLSARFEEDKLAAMVSNTVGRMRRALKEWEPAPIRRITLSSSHGKLVFTDVGIAWLIVVLDPRADLRMAELEIESTARRIRSRGEMKHSESEVV